MRSGSVRALTLIMALMLGSPALAERIGTTHGRLWPIAEPDLVEQIHELIKKFEASGELDEVTQRFREETLAVFSDPPPVPGISHAAEERTWHFDPSIAFSEDVADEEGRIIARAGRVYNPFDYIALTKSIVFIDARSERQTHIAERYLAADPRNRIVLVGGSWRELQDRWRVKVYFDQHGKLTSHFGITRVPAILSQEGRLVRIDEVPE